MVFGERMVSGESIVSGKNIVHGEHSLNFSSLALTVCDLWYYKDMEEKDDSLNEWMNEWMTRLFIEQPGYTGSVKNTILRCFD